MRIAVTLLLVGLAGCGSAATDAPEGALASGTVDVRAPVAAFVPPSPAGCAAAAPAYDVCFAFEDATPLAVRVALPTGTPASAVGVVRFVRASGAREKLQLDELKFKVGDKPELRFYFQIYPGAYRIEVGVDMNGDGDPDGPADVRGWSSLSPDVAVFDESEAAIVDVGLRPIETAFRVEAPK
jgi:hypothetical protein